MLYNDFLKNRGDKVTGFCPFCNPKDITLKDNQFAFLTYSLAPYHPHHLLVIPKRHVGSIMDLKRKEIKAIDSLIRYATEILHACGYRAFSVLMRDGADNPTKSVEHLHYNLIPATSIGDLDHKGNKRKIMTAAQIKKTVADLRKAQKKLK